MCERVLLWVSVCIHAHVFVRVPVCTASPSHWSVQLALWDSVWSGPHLPAPSGRCREAGTGNRLPNLQPVQMAGLGPNVDCLMFRVCSRQITRFCF